jgi:CheY-like chemotaxis protein
MDHKPKVLVVEDDQFLRDFYNELLQSEGFQTDTAADGEAGLQKILLGGWGLIMLDIMMPKKDGIQVLRDLQQTKPQSANGPIVVLTNLGTDAIINQCFALGAKGYLIKSAMDPDQVLQEINGFLQNS